MEKHTMPDMPKRTIANPATMADISDEETNGSRRINELVHLIKGIQIDENNPDEITALENKVHSDVTKQLVNDKTVKVEDEEKDSTDFERTTAISNNGYVLTDNNDMLIGTKTGEVTLLPRGPTRRRDTRHAAPQDEHRARFSPLISNARRQDEISGSSDIAASPQSAYSYSTTAPLNSIASPLNRLNLLTTHQTYGEVTVSGDTEILPQILPEINLGDGEIDAIFGTNYEDVLIHSQPGQAAATFATEDGYSTSNTGLVLNAIYPPLQLDSLTVRETAQEATPLGRYLDEWDIPDRRSQSLSTRACGQQLPDTLPQSRPASSSGYINCAVDAATSLTPHTDHTVSATTCQEGIISHNRPNVTCQPMTIAEKFYSSLSEKEKMELPQWKRAIRAQSLDHITVPDEDGDTMLHNYIIYAPEVEQKNCLPRWKSKLAIYCLLRRLWKDHRPIFEKFINMRNKHGQTPLYLAVYDNFPEAVDLLLSYGANPNLRRGKEGNHNGPVPLHKAMELGDRGLDCLKLLLSYEECDLNMQDNEGLTPLMRGCTKHTAPTDPNNDPTTQNEEVINSIQSVKLLLNDARVNPCLKAAKCGRTALHFAVQSKDPKLVEVFGPHARREHPEMLTVCGARLDLINVVNFVNDNVLHTIAGLSMIDKKKQIKIGELLLSFGANVAAMNSSNKLPRTVAKACNNPELGNLFRLPRTRPSPNSRSTTLTSSNSPVMSPQYYNTDYSSSSSVSQVTLPYDRTPEYGTVTTYSEFGVSTESSTNYFAFGSPLSGPIDTNTTFVYGSSPSLNVHHSPPSSQYSSPYSYQSTVASEPTPTVNLFSPMSEHSHTQQDDEDPSMFGAATLDELY